MSVNEDRRGVWKIPFTDWELKMQSRRQTIHGQEVPDPTPVAPPVGYVRQPSLAEQVREMVRSEALRQAAEAAGFETFDEADDFDIPDDPVDPNTPYEAEFEPFSEVRARAAAAAQAESPSGSGGPKAASAAAPTAGQVSQSAPETPAGTPSPVPSATPKP